MALSKLVISWRQKKLLLKNIRKEICFFFDICHQLSSNIGITNTHKILTKSVYFEFLDKVKLIEHHLKKLLQPLSMSQFKKTSSIIYALKLSKIRLELINIVQIVGCVSISNILKLFVNTEIQTLQYDEYSDEVIAILEKLFIPINCELFKSEQVTEKHGLEDTNIQSPLIVKNNLFTKSFSMRLYGCKVFIPYNQKSPQQLFVMTGFFRKEIIPEFNRHPLISQKFIELKIALENNKMEPDFRLGFLESIQSKDLLLQNSKELIDAANYRHSEFKRIYSKVFSDILKEFVNTEIENQYEMISTLLLNAKRKENIYIANVLFDMLEKDVNSTYQIIYQSLHWKQQQLVYTSKQSENSVSKDLLKFTEDNIPLEKRVMLMKAPEYVKSKALEKLKEVSGNKGGENTIKAQQYVEGLLKIPFYQYQEEPELTYLHHFKNSFRELLRGIPAYQKNAQKISKSYVSIDRFFNSFEEIVVKNAIKSSTSKKLREICGQIDISKTGKKKELTEKLLAHSNKIKLSFFPEIDNYFQTKDATPTQQQQLIQKNTEWINYRKERKSYLKKVDHKLNQSVYGMENAKGEIKRIIAQWINGDKQGYILGFEGPPGTGKTTLGKKGISECLVDKKGKSRPFVFIALGGSTNGSTLEGHNYTYVGSTWGKITDSLIEAKCMNPIIYIDELDKISKTEHGKEIIGILIHLTDPSQNEEFVDKYFTGIKIDISKCLIIFSYNDVSMIDKVLLDRIHRIKIDAISRHEKYQICIRHLIPEITEIIGYREDDIIITEELIYQIIDNYTLEAGARKLKECLFDIYREINLRAMESDEISFPFTITQSFVEDVFKNKPKIQLRTIYPKPTIGLVNGLYATSAGIGGITIIECCAVPSENHLSLLLTGQQGDVMKESMSVAKTLACHLLESKKNWKSPYSLYAGDHKIGLHVHCPEGAQPKDGPSAGIAITVAIYSRLSGQRVKNTVAVTGEVDLSGHALEIGGLDSKLEGAKKAGVTLALYPRKNQHDIDKLKKSKHNPIDENFKVIAIDTIEDALRLMLVEEEDDISS